MIVQNKGSDHLCQIIHITILILNKHLGKDALTKIIIEDDK